MAHLNPSSTPSAPFTIPERLCEAHGYPALTPTTKQKILGDNASALYGIEPGLDPVTSDRGSTTRATTWPSACRRSVIGHAFRWLRYAPRVSEGDGDSAPASSYQPTDRARVALHLLKSTADDEIFARRTEHMQPLASVLSVALDQMESRTENPDSIAGTKTGFREVDRALSGLRPGHLVVVAGRPDSGASTFALNVAMNVTMRGNRPVLFISLQEESVELAQRVMSAEAGVELERMLSGHLRADEWNRVAQTLPRLGNAAFYIDDDPNATTMEIYEKMLHVSEQHSDIGLMVVDRLQLVRGRATAESWDVAMTEITRALKIMAREFQCPVLAVSELSRGADDRPGSKPRLSDLRGSDAIEQIADVVLLLHRLPATTQDPLEATTCELIVAKDPAGHPVTMNLLLQVDFSRLR
jgi:replicative DNA helicase